MNDSFIKLYLLNSLSAVLWQHKYSLCRVLGSMRWMVLVTRMHTHTWPMFPRLCASRGERQTTLSCNQTTEVRLTLKGKTLDLLRKLMTCQSLFPQIKKPLWCYSLDKKCLSSKIICWWQNKKSTFQICVFFSILKTTCMTRVIQTCNGKTLQIYVLLL